MASALTCLGRHDWFESHEHADTLVVIVHGSGWWNGRSQAKMRGAVEVAREAFAASDCFVPRLPLEFWRFRSAERIVDRVRRAVSALWQRREAAGAPYARVVLVGFSFGSVIVRRTFVEACGIDDRAVRDAARADAWTGAVSRLVLLAGMNRGWTVASPVNRVREGLVRVSTGIAHLLSAIREPTLFAIRRGAPFLTTTRLGWLALPVESRPVTVQLLGTRDDLVSPADNIDLATGAGFHYLEVPASGHFDVVDMSQRQRDGRRARRHPGYRDTIVARRAAMRLALAGSPDLIAADAIAPEDLADAAPLDPEAAPHGGVPAVRPDVNLVVCVMHGIRDKGYWTQKVARAVKAAAPPGCQVRSWTSTYGYFAMLPFLCPWTRRAKVEWFLDQYVSARAIYPRAAFAFIGHSNGTYLFGSALERCAAVRFQHAVLAGSVLRSRFDWRRLIERGQVAGVRNYVATSDWVLAAFPRLFEVLPLQDLGSAGHDGFRDEPQGPISDVEYVPGRHAAALDESRWPEMAAFVLHGPGAAPAPPRAVRARRHPAVVALGYGSPVIWTLAVAGAVAPVGITLQALGFDLVPQPAWWEPIVGAARALPAWVMALALAGWGAFLRILLTKL